MADSSMIDHGYTVVRDIAPLMAKEDLKEIALQAVWSVSTNKPGYGVGLLRDNKSDTYWQSDGFQPHMVNIQFRKKTTIHSLAIYVDYKSDESYTPSKISIRIGSDFNDLREIEKLPLNEPSGWLWFKLHDRPQSRPVRTFMIQIAILQNHQNGRDTHLRQIKIFSTEHEETRALNKILRGQTLPHFQSVAASQFCTIR